MARRTRSAVRGVALAGVLALIPLVAVDAAAGVPEDAAARKAAAQQSGGRVADMTVLTRGDATYPLSGRYVHTFKIQDRRTGLVYVVLLNDDRREVSRTALAEREASAYAARFGKLDPQLAARLRSARDDERIEISAWFAEPPYQPGTRPHARSIRGPAELERVYAAAAERRAKFVRRVMAPIQQRLAELGERGRVDDQAPVLSGSLTAASIRRIASWNETQLVYLAGDPKPALSIAGPAVGANTVHGNGITGSGVKVGQIEVDGRVAMANPYLSGHTIQNQVGLCANASTHATAVAGVLVSSHSPHKGIAPGATLHAAGGCDSLSPHLEGRATALKNLGVSVFNASYGDDVATRKPTSHDKFYDSMVINDWRTVVAAAGNEASPCATSANVTSPGLGYNVITVGAYNHGGTVNPVDDVMDPCSSWRDPISFMGDREKPDLVAPGDTLKTTSWVDPWIGTNNGGTSLAAPMVTGTAALLIQKVTGLAAWSVSIRSILAAAAFQNLEGGTRLSEKDGAGALDARRAYYTVAGAANTGFDMREYFCSDPSSLTLAEPTLTGNRRTRIAIAWDSDPAYANYANEPSADLDLFVYGPNGVEVARSTSHDNTTEIVDFTTAAAGGKYKIKATRSTCDLSPRSLAWAWYNRS